MITLPEVSREEVRSALSARESGYRVSIIVPSIAPDGFKFSHKAVCDAVTYALSDLFGGATLSVGRGAWIDNKDALIGEDNTEVWALVDANCAFSDTLANAAMLALQVRKATHNDCVLWAVVPVAAWGLA